MVHKILFIGDIVGKGGRNILRQVLPQWKEQYRSDVVIVNVENLAHGKGVTPATLGELDELNIDCYTSGNHIFKKNSLTKECFDQYPKLIRPANFLAPSPSEGRVGERLSDPLPGHGYYRFSKNNQQYLVINLNGQVFMEKQFDGEIANPFLTLDRILSSESQKGDIIIVDFHAEATSEKIALGYYLDGRVAGVFGTHTHVPTADARILSKGTAHVSDVGMTGSLNGVIGVKYEGVIKKFLDPNAKFKNEPEEEGVLQINGVLVEASTDGKATAITKLYQEINN